MRYALLAINFSAMADIYHKHGQDLVMDRVNNSITSDPKRIFPPQFPLQGLALKWVFFQSIQSVGHAPVDRRFTASHFFQGMAGLMGKLKLIAFQWSA